MSDYFSSGLKQASGVLYAEYIDSDKDRIVRALVKQAAAADKQKHANAIGGALLGGLVGAGKRALQLRGLAKAAPKAGDDVLKAAKKIREAQAAAKTSGQISVLSPKDALTLRNAKFLEGQSGMKAAGKWRTPGAAASDLEKGVASVKNIGEAGWKDVLQSGASGAVTGGVAGKGLTLAKNHFAKKKLMNTAKRVAVPAAVGLGAGLAIS